MLGNKPLPGELVRREVSLHTHITSCLFMAKTKGEQRNDTVCIPGFIASFRTLVSYLKLTLSSLACLILLKVLFS